MNYLQSAILLYTFSTFKFNINELQSLKDSQSQKKPRGKGKANYESILSVLVTSRIRQASADEDVDSVESMPWLQSCFSSFLTKPNKTQVPEVHMHILHLLK